MSTFVIDLPNLGPRSAEWLQSIGVETEADLRAIGAVEAYCLIRAQRQGASLNLLYALEGALTQRPWNSFSAEEKAALQAAVERFGFGES